MGNPYNTSPLLLKLYRQGAYRWIIFAAGLAMLLWLWVTAGQVRHPGAKKRKWAVVASRVLVVAGAIFFARLVFVTHEDRLPVIYISLGETGLRGEDVIRSIHQLKRRGYEDIPIDDVVMFIREARYVPRKAFASIVEFQRINDIGGLIEQDLPHLVVMLPDESLRQSKSESFPLPYAVSPAVKMKVDEDPVKELTEMRKIGEGIFGKEIQCALLESLEADEMRRTARRSGYLCFFDGHGYNRFGDEPHLVRLLDVSRIVAQGGALRLWLSLELFRGNFIVWPLAAIRRLDHFL